MHDLFMQNQLTNILQQISWGIGQSLIYFAGIYVLWFIAKKTVAKKISPAAEYQLLLLLLTIGLLRFFWQVFSFGNPNPQYFTEVLPDAGKQIFITVTGTGYLLYLVIKFAFIFLSIKRVGKTERIALHRPDLETYLSELSDFLKIKTPVLFVSLKNAVPYTTGFFKKIIVLPVAFLTQLTEPELEAVILHELAHIFRKDHYTNYILVLSGIFMGFNPFVKILLKQIRYQRELACDDWVIAQHIRPKNYARALQKSAQLQYQQQQFHLAFSVPPNDLLYRIQRIFKKEEPLKTGVQLLPFLSLLGLLLLQPSGKTVPVLPNRESPVFTASLWELPVNNNTLAKGNSLWVSAKKRHKQKPDPVKKQKPSPSIEKLSGYDMLIPVTDRNEQVLQATIINNSNSSIAGSLLQLRDSILLFQESISGENILSATQTALTGILQTIVSLNETAKENLVLTADPIPISVTQEGTKNLYYHSVHLLQTTLFDAAAMQWKIELKLVNGTVPVATRYITVSLLKKLKSISL
jgi:beta-lactamase regulating signal transducer with metallopeptidase domain